MTNSRRKGINGELEAVKLWQPYFPGVRRSFGQARMGYEYPDLIGGMIERSFYIEVKRTKRPPRKREIEIWWAKIRSDFEKYVLSGGEKSEYLLLMCRADYWSWSVEFLEAGSAPDPILVSWVDFESMLDLRLSSSAVLSPTKVLEVER